MGGMNAMTTLNARVERRCAVCGCRASGKSCEECGSPVAQRADIGILAGVNNNFGTVNNVYNIGAQPEPDVVDLRDVQDGLNDRFPERIPTPPKVPGQLGDGSVTRRVNTAVYVLGAVALASLIAVVAAFLWA
jgi:hypothetical protein